MYSGGIRVYLFWEYPGIHSGVGYISPSITKTAKFGTRVPQSEYVWMYQTKQTLGLLLSFVVVGDGGGYCCCWSCRCCWSCSSALCPNFVSQRCACVLLFLGLDCKQLHNEHARVYKKHNIPEGIIWHAFLLKKKKNASRIPVYQVSILPTKTCIYECDGARILFSTCTIPSLYISRADSECWHAFDLTRWDTCLCSTIKYQVLNIHT